jgi:hypothetical protein
MFGMLADVELKKKDTPSISGQLVFRKKRAVVIKA